MVLILLKSSTHEQPDRFHVHVLGASGEAQHGVSPVVALAESNGFDARTLRELLGIVEQNAELIERTWNEYFC